MHLSSKNFTDERQARRFQLGVRNLNYGTTVTCGEATAKSSELAGKRRSTAALMNRFCNLRALLLSKLSSKIVAFKSCWNLLCRISKH